MTALTRSKTLLPVEQYRKFCRFKPIGLGLFTWSILSLGILLLLAGALNREEAKAFIGSGEPTVHLQVNRPNFILLLTDDLDMSPVSYMPNLQALLIEQGLTFSNTFVTQSFCCPSRSSILRGQYPHNHKIQANDPPDGGFQKFRNLGRDNSTLATWLQKAGYRTTLMGKYLNGYNESKAGYIPPGWTEWYAVLQEGAYFNYAMNENGRIVRYSNAAADYSTDVLASKAVDFIQRAASSQQPFFIYLAPFAPHMQSQDEETGNFMPPIPAPRHQGMFQNEQAPRSPSFNEPDVSDKPPWIRKLPLLSAGQINQVDALHRARLESMLAVDDMIETLVQTLASTGELNNTFILFTSDNGFRLGQHRLIWGKMKPYEEDIHVPLVIRGPGIPAGQTRQHLALNIDLAPTLAELAGVSIPKFVDGRSLVPLLGNAPPPLADWRQRFLVERRPPSAVKSGAQTVYWALRTRRYSYVEYAQQRELYDLNVDPYQLDNFYARANPQLIKQLAAQLASLRICAKAPCRTAEGPALTSQEFINGLYLPLIMKTETD